MVYAVDVVYDIMKEISFEEPVLFQRDGSLYIASNEGFGQVTYGLPIHPQKKESWEKELDCILESEAIFEGYKSGEPKIAIGEESYLKAIAFGSDDKALTLEGVILAARELSKLSNDEKIRMISHDTSYHSHKYGYAVDGVDVCITGARKIDKEKYLDFIRKNEESTFGQLSELTEGYCKLIGLSS